MENIWYNAGGGIKDCFRINQNTLPKAFADCQAQNKKLLDHDSNIVQIQADSQSDLELRKHIIDKIIDAKTTATNKSSINLSSLKASVNNYHVIAGAGFILLILFLWWYKSSQQNSTNK